MSIMDRTAARVKVRTACAATLVAAEIRTFLTSRNYTPIAREAAAAWVASRGALIGCPVIEREDIAAVDAMIARAEGARPGGRNLFVPSEEDRAWAVAYFATGKCPELADDQAEADCTAGWPAWVDLEWDAIDFDAFDDDGNPFPPARAAAEPRFDPLASLGSAWSDHDQLAAHGCV